MQCRRLALLAKNVVVLNGFAVPPARVTVTSSKGGVDTEAFALVNARRLILLAMSQED